MSASLWIVEPDETLAAAMTEHLSAAGHRVRTEGALAAAEERLAEADLAILSLAAAGKEAETILRQCQGRTAVIFTAPLSAGASLMPRVVELIRAGAADCLLQPVAGVDLLRAVTRALKVRRLEDRVRRLEGEVETLSGAAAGLVGAGPAMTRLKEEIARVAPFATPVLILGETGAGKELVARAVHKASGRLGEFVAVNAAAFSQELFEAEVFGYEPGAFTGAKGRKTGLVEQADQGTFFLDEIGELAQPIQARLLRFLDDGAFRRLGGVRELVTHVRVIAATNRPVADQAERVNGFRNDLYYRLSAYTITVPPLRERTEDIPELAIFFARNFAAQHGLPAAVFGESALQALRVAPWPGNVRELKNFIERLIMTHPGLDRVEEAEVKSLATITMKAGATAGGYQAAREEQMTSFDRDYFKAALGRHNGNISAAARELGMDRKTLGRKLKALGLDVEE